MSRGGNNFVYLSTSPTAPYSRHVYTPNLVSLASLPQLYNWSTAVLACHWRPPAPSGYYTSRELVRGGVLGHSVVGHATLRYSGCSLQRCMLTAAPLPT